MDEQSRPARSYTLKPVGGTARQTAVAEALGRYLGKDPVSGSRIGKGLFFSPPPARPTSSGTEGPSAADRPLSDLAFIGQLWRTYLVLADQDRFVLLDQHAAHERVTFERLRRAAAQGVVKSQRLLVPVQLEIDEGMSAVVEEQSERLNSIGFEIEPFGDRTISVKAAPALLSKAPVVQLVQDVLGDLAESDREASWEDRQLAVLSRMACHGSVRAGKDMSEDEVRALLRQVEEVDFSTRCPHGRPVLRSFSRAEVEHWFLRA